MTRVFQIFAVVAGVATGVLYAGQQSAFRSSISTVSVRATVVDATGHVVTGLTAADFEVFDNGRPQPLTVFDAGQHPISIVVMLDRSSSMRPHEARVEDAARAFVANLLPDDRARLGSFASDIRVEPEEFTGDTATLYRIIERSPDSAGATPLWLATSIALDALETEDRQRVVLVFTDGRDSPAFSEDVTFADILSRVRREDAIVYAVGLAHTCDSPASSAGRPSGSWYQSGRPRFPPRSRLPSPRPPIRIPVPGTTWPPSSPVPTPPRRRALVETCRETGPDPDLRELAIAGGGGYFELRSSDDLASAFERVATELHSQYLLGFVPAEFDGTVHALSVRVRQTGMTVRARRTYLAKPR